MPLFEGPFTEFLKHLCNSNSMFPKDTGKGFFIAAILYHTLSVWSLLGNVTNDTEGWDPLPPASLLVPFAKEIPSPFQRLCSSLWFHHSLPILIFPPYTYYSLIPYSPNTFMNPYNS